MSLYAWVLIVLCAAGVILPLIATVGVLVAALRLNKRVTTLLESPFVTKLESLQIQVDRLARTSEDFKVLQARARSAVDSLRAGFSQTADLREACDGLRSQIGTIAQTLR